MAHLNGWQFSGITQLQSGANITYSGGYNVNTNYNMALSCPDPADVPQSGAVIPGFGNHEHAQGHRN